MVRLKGLAKQLQYTPEETQAFVPLSNTTIQHLIREITAEEMKTQLWMDAVIICTSNRERAMFNLQAAVRKATTDCQETFSNVCN